MTLSILTINITANKCYHISINLIVSIYFFDDLLRLLDRFFAPDEDLRLLPPVMLPPLVRLTPPLSERLLRPPDKLPGI